MMSLCLGTGNFCSLLQARGVIETDDRDQVFDYINFFVKDDGRSGLTFTRLYFSVENNVLVHSKRLGPP